VYIELQLDLPLSFIGNVLMVSTNVHSSQLIDENVALMDVESEYYCHGLLKPSEVRPLHFVFSLKGVLAKQGKSFKLCILTVAKWYKNLSNPYVIPKLNLQEFMQRCLQ